MADRTLFTYEQALAGAGVLKASLAASKVRFFDGTLVPTVETTRQQMIDAETTLTGYPVGGYDLAAMLGPDFASGGGAYIITPAIDVQYASGDSVTIGGAWIDDGDDLPRVTFIFDPQRTLSTVGQGFQLIRSLFYGQNFVG